MEKHISTPFSKKCPRCDKELFYKRKNALVASIKKNWLCRNCGKDNIRNTETEFKKNCPICKKELIYASQSALKLSLKKNCVCHQCNTQRIMANPSDALQKTFFKKGDRPKNADMRKGKTLIELYGEERAKEIINKYKHRICNEEANKKRSISCKLAGCGLTNKGRKCTAENKKKFRLLMVARLQKTNKSFHPPYNEKACAVFDALASATNTHISHALNGGEVHLPSLGYWVDGYDKTNNIV